MGVEEWKGSYTSLEGILHDGGLGSSDGAGGDEAGEGGDEGGGEAHVGGLVGLVGMVVVEKLVVAEAEARS